MSAPKRQRIDSEESSLPPLSLSILGVDPIDDFIKQIADVVHRLILSRNDISGKIEVEAKIGLLVAPNKARLNLPVLNETILAPGLVDCRFRSNMSIAQHKNFNERLNALRTTTSDSPDAPSPLEYHHLHLIDKIYPNKLRVTTNEQTGDVVECIQKVNLGHINIFNPNHSADWRVSINMEIPCPLPSEDAIPELTRRKDRMSYTHEEFTIDLTQVNQQSSQTNELLHELEIEITRSDFLLSTAKNRSNPNLPEPERSAFDELLRAFVNNARILARNASNEWQ